MEAEKKCQNLRRLIELRVSETQHILVLDFRL